MLQSRTGSIVILLALAGCAGSAPTASAPIAATPEQVSAPLAARAAGGCGMGSPALWIHREEARLAGTSDALAAESIYANARARVQDTDLEPDLHATLALMALMTNHLDVARSENERALSLSPIPRLEGMALNNLGQVDYLEEDFATARVRTDEAARLLQDGPGYDIAVSNLAEFDSLAGDLASAEARLLAIPGSSPVMFSRARLADVSGRTEEALELEREALALDPYGVTRRHQTFVWPELRLHSEALEAEAKGQERTAIETWSKLHESACGGLRWAPLAGVADEHLMRLGATVPACAPAAPVVVVAKTEIPRAPVVAGTVAVPVVAAPPATVVVPTAPASSGVTLTAFLDHKALGVTALYEHQLDVAEREFQLALQQDARDVEAHEGAGVVRYLREDFAAARGEMETALRLADRPESVAVLLSSLGDLDTISGDLSGAEEKLNEALKSAPESAVAYYELAILYDLTGRLDAARLMERQAIELDANETVRDMSLFVWPECRLQFEGLRAEAIGDLATARRYWTALEIMEASGQLRWKALTGRAAAHLALLPTISVSAAEAN